MKKIFSVVLALVAIVPEAEATPLFYERVQVGLVQFIKDDTDANLYYQLPARFETYWSKWGSHRGSLAVWVKARAVYDDKAAAELQREFGGPAMIVRLASPVRAELTPSKLFEEAHCEEAPAMELNCLLPLKKDAERIFPEFRAGFSFAAGDAFITVQALDSFGKLSSYEHAYPVRAARPAQR